MRLEGIAADVIQAPKLEPRITRYELSDYEMTTQDAWAIEPAMINLATSNYWYFSFDSSLAVGGSRSI